MCIAPQVPYGTAFHSNVQWACQHSGKGKARLRITGQVEFTKGCFVKGVITKATQEVGCRLPARPFPPPLLCSQTALSLPAGREEGWHHSAQQAQDPCCSPLTPSSPCSRPAAAALGCSQGGHCVFLCLPQPTHLRGAAQGMREAYAQLMDILRAQLGTAAPVSAATVAQRVASTSEGVHGRLGGLQALLCLALVALLLLGWGVWRLDRGLQAQLRLLQQLARG